MPDHNHVIAVQDWGGAQERFRGFDDQLTREQAEQLVADMADADELTYQHGRGTEAYDRYGDRFDDLVSGNVCPGWEAIWIITCTTACLFEEVFHADDTRVWGNPVWTPGPAEPRRHLHLVP